MKFKDLIDLLGLTVYDEEIKNYIKNAMSVIEAKLHAHSNKTVLDNTTASFTEALLSKLNGIEAGANKMVVDSTLSASSENPVQNKIVKSALDTKVPTSRKINGKALTADITLTASDVSAIPASEKGAAGGVAELDANGKILTSMLPGSIDEYIEGWLSSGSFYKEEAHTTKITPKTDAIYLDLHTMKTYRWSGSAYGVISETLAIGTTSSTAGRGDWTKAAYDHSLSAHAPSNAERNIIIGIQKNGTDLAIDSNTRKVNITVPTKLSELTNDKNFVDNTHTHTKANITDLNKQLTSENLDDIKSVGFYYAGGGNTTTNKPTDVDAYGMIVTHAASGYRKQILYSSSNRTYERLYNSSTWSSWRDITVETAVPTNAKFTDTNTKVTNTLATTTKAYITGTTSATTNTGTQVFDTGVYLDTVAGQLVATTFKGNLIGNVTGSITGDISGYSKSLYNYFSGRQSSLNFDLKNYNNKVFYTLATSSATEGKPPVDSSILTFAWDNSGWGAQIALGINKVAHMYIRGAGSVTTDGVVSSDWASSWFTVLDSNNYNSYALPLTGGTMTGNLLFSNTGNTANSWRGIKGTNGGNDFWYIRGSQTASDGGFLEIATADGGNEPIYVRQYSGTADTLGTNIKRTLTLLDASGNSNFPGTVTASTFVGVLNGNASSATKATQDGNGNTITSTYATKSELNTAKSNLQASIDVLDDAKVDKVSGKGLSTNDYTTTEKTKLSGIATGAEVNQNAFSNIKVGDTTVAADAKTDTLTLAGSNVTLTPDATNDKVTIGITKANVVSALGYTPPTTDTVYTHPTTAGNKHIPAGGSSGQILRWSADGTAVWGSDNNTDTKATQTNTTTAADYRVVLSTNANDTTETNTLRKSANFTANPNTGAFYAKGYDRIDITGQTLDIDTLTLSAGSPEIMRYIEKTSGGAANITNIPVTGVAFILDVELIRWAGTTDYVTKQTFISVGAKANEYVRYCTSGTWDASWTKRVFTDNNTTYTLSSFGITATAAEINKLDGLTATTTELNYIDGVTSAIQGQLDSKQAVITGGATTILSSNLTTKRVLISDSNGKVAVSAITSTELGYLEGVTSNIQTQLKGKISNNVFLGGGTSGTNGYVAFAQLLIKSNYTNRPIEFELICRGKATPCYVSIMFSNTNSTDPSIQSLSYWGTDYGVFAEKIATSTWLLYYTKSEGYDSVTVAKIQAAEQGVTITYPGTFITEKPTENVISAILGGSISFASTATTASKVAGTKTNPTSGTTYYIPFHTNAITENKALLNNDGLRYWTKEGTTSAVGEAEIGIGNNIASGTAGNKRGSIYMYGSSSGYTQIFPGNNTTSNINITLPSAGGTLALTTSKVSGATTADKVINALTVKLNGGSTEGTNLFTFNGSVAKTINITPSSIGASSTNHTHGLLHSSFAKLIDNTTIDSGWSMLNSTYKGYLLLSLRTQKDAPVWTIGDYSAGIAFGGADTKGVITVSYSKPIIKFAGGNGTTPVWNLAVTGTTGTSYNLDNLTKVKQSATTTSNYRPLVMGAANSTDTSTLANTVTDVVCTATTIYAQPSTGTIFATKFKGAFEGNVTGNVSGTATKLAVKATVSTYDFTPSTYISDGQIAGIYNNNGSIDSNGFAAGNTSAGILFGRTNGAVMMAAQAGQTNPAIWVKEYYSAWGAWAKLIHSLNYTDYTVTKTGSGASGTWGISISGSAPKLTTARKISLGTSVTGSASFDGSSDITIAVSAPTTVGGTIPYAGSDVSSVTVLTDFSKYRSYLGSTTIDGTWYNIISVRHRNGASDGTSYGFYLQSKLTSTGNLIWNKQYGASSWQGERTILDSSNYTSYTVKKDGTGASGTWGISITGNASTATSATKATQDGNGSTITSTYLKLSGGTMSGNLTFASVTSTTYPALSNKIVWSGSTDGADIYYRVDANDAGRLVFNLRDDADTLICFAKNGTDFATINTSGVFSGYAALLANVGANCSTGKSTWNAGIEGKIVWGQKWNSTDFTYTNSEGTATTITDSGDVSFYLTGSSTANRLYLNMAIDGSIYAEKGFSGNLSGTATKATQDSAGQQINTTYIKALSVSGQTITYTKGSGATGTITTQDKNVYQSASTTSNFRPLLMGHTNTTSASSLGTAVTNQTYVNTAIFAQPSTGTIYATKFSGALVGNSDTTTKWKTARTITINGDFTGSVSLDGSANVSFNLWNYYGKVSVGNTNNYPYHRIAKLDTITSSYQDRASTLYISQDYNDGGFGIIRICLRTNNTGSASSVEAYWLVRKGLAEDSVKIGIYNVFGETYADVFFKTGGTYARTVVRDIASGTRGAVNRTWTLINSGESNGTTTTDKLASYECWIDIETAATELHSQAYSTIVTSSDAGDVYRSERAYNDESGNNIKTSYAASLSVSGTTVTLKSKSGATLSTITTQDNDTKNTAGSTNSSSKLFLIGATSQATNPQTYSHDTAYVNTDGHLYSNSKQVVNLSDSQALTNKTYNGYTLAAACAKAVTNNTSVGSLGWSSSIGATNVPTMNTIAYWNGAYSGTSSNLAYCTKGAFGSIVTKNTGDYLSSSGGTLTGPLTISHQTSATMSSDTNNPRIVFSENGEQPVILAYTDYDSYRRPAGLKVLGGSSASPAWFEVEGNLYASTVTASTFIGSLTGTATNAKFLANNTSYDYSNTGLSWFNADLSVGASVQANDAPVAGWWHMLRFNHSNSNAYYTDLAVPFNNNSLYYKCIRDGAVANNGWVKVLDGLNYSSSITSLTKGLTVFNGNLTPLTIKGGVSGNLESSISYTHPEVSSSNNWVVGMGTGGTGYGYFGFWNNAYGNVMRLSNNGSAYVSNAIYFGWQVASNNNKVRMFTDSEGGNISLVSPNNIEYQIDTVNDIFRIYRRPIDGSSYVSVLETQNSSGHIYNAGSKVICARNFALSGNTLYITTT